LYPVSSSEKPQDDALRVATMLRSQQTPNRLAIIVSEIRFEIAHPTQNVRDILDSYASEKDLREYLSRVVEKLRTDSPTP
jgi:reverse gyrase